jgi:diguanylate cyclase (GGDEF)-like protein
MLDIDHFKKINDSMGHEAGDRMLKAAAALMKKCVRANDYVTRYGGDEFCLILDVVNDAGLQRVVSRIQGALQALNQSGSLPYPLSFSMGHAVYDFGEHLAPEIF